MAFDPENPKHLDRLSEAIEWSNQQAEPFCERRIEHFRQLAGHQFGENAADDKVPIPMMALAYRIYKRFISTRNPQGVVATQYRDLIPHAKTLEIALNHTLTKKNFGDTLTEAASEALFRRGCVQVGVDKEGELFADSILLEDQIIDMRARSKREELFRGHKFPTSLEEAREDESFDAEVRKLLKEYDPTDGRDDGTRAVSDSQQISIGMGVATEGLEDQVVLTQIWIPSQRMILIMPPNKLSKKPLKVIENWKGPECGPYIDIGFGYIPGSRMPQGIMSMIYEMHLATNELFNKAIRQAKRQKTNPIVKNSLKDEADTFAEVADGQVMFSDDPSGWKEVTSGGANQATLAMVMWAKEMGMTLGGNLTALGGLAAQSGTVGQDKLLNDSANETVADIQQDTLDFAKKAIESVAWHLWNDPMVDVTIFKPILNTGVTFPTKFNRENRKGDFFQYNFDIDPYSLKPKSPAERASIAEGFLQKMIIPLMPAMQQSGMAVDWEYVFKLFARYGNAPELDQMMIYTGQQHIEESSPEGRKMPAATERKYIRENRSTGTRAGQEQALISSLMAGGNKQPEMAALGKPAE